MDIFFFFNASRRDIFSPAFIYIITVNRYIVKNIKMIDFFCEDGYDSKRSQFMFAARNAALRGKQVRDLRGTATVSGSPAPARTGSHWYFREDGVRMKSTSQETCMNGILRERCTPMQNAQQ